MGTPHSIYIFMDNPSASDGLSVNSNKNAAIISVSKSVKEDVYEDFSLWGRGAWV
jgi:hypothetical protein